MMIKVNVGRMGDEMLLVFGENLKRFYDRNKDPSLCKGSLSELQPPTIEGVW